MNLHDETRSIRADGSSLVISMDGVKAIVGRGLQSRQRLRKGRYWGT